MDVTISAPVNTFFIRIFGIQTIQASRNSKALFTQPVPMGSPQNYFGVFGAVRNATFTQGGVMTTTNADLSGPGTTCANGVVTCFRDVGGQTLTPGGFWGTMNSEGAENVNGDAYLPYYDTATSTPALTCGTTAGLSACYDPTSYYNYAISMPPNTTGGKVYIFDPGFCATLNSSGTGDHWFGGGTPISSWYELFNTHNTPYDISDDSLVKSSGSLFADQAASDSTMGGPGGSNECKQTNVPYGDARDYHDAWYLLNPANPLSGGPNGTVYRLHTTTSAPAGQGDLVNQKTANGEQSFAILANDNQGGALLPTVYGLGAMQMFTPLTAGASTVNSEFYLAQVARFYAGKTLELNLWDPGDTNTMSATLRVLIPTSPTSYAPTPFTYSAATGTTNSARNGACNSNSNSSPSNSSVQTSNGGSVGLFNGCWLTLDVPIPASYTGDQDGWWKMQYSMFNTVSGTTTSNDVTTWTARILGNPVHLIVP